MHRVRQENSEWLYNAIRQVGLFEMPTPLDGLMSTPIGRANIDKYYVDCECMMGSDKCPSPVTNRQDKQ